MPDLTKQQLQDRIAELEAMLAGVPGDDAGLTERFAYALSLIPDVPKDKTVTVRMGTSTYTHSYATLEAMLKVVRPALARARIAMWWSLEGWESERFERLERITAHMSLTLAHGDERHTINYDGVGSDTGDKALQKAYTGGTRYAIKMLFLIDTPDEVDPEAENPEPPAGVEPTRRQRPQIQPRRSQQQQSTNVDPTLISPEQRGRMWAIAREHAWPESDIRDLILQLTGETSSERIPKVKYDQLVARLRGGPPSRSRGSEGEDPSADSEGQGTPSLGSGEGADGQTTLA